MLQSLRPAFQAAIRSPGFQRFAFAVGAGVTTLYTIRAIDGISTGFKSRSLAKKRRKLAASEAKKATTAVAKETADNSVAPELHVVGTVSPTDQDRMDAAALTEAVVVVMDGANYNDLRATAKALGLDVGTHPTKESLAQAIVTYQADKNEDSSSN